MITIIGCGGIGSWVTPSVRLLTSDAVTLVDGDKLERKNLNRQLFSIGDIGRNKAEALAQKYKCHAVPQWYYNGLISHEKSDWILVCVDNMPARKAALEASDSFGCKVIIAANETHSAEAFIYDPEWRDSPLDPRVYIPEIETDKSHNPMQAAGCTGEAQASNPQLVTSNATAAALMGGLLSLWKNEAAKMEKEDLSRLPYRRVINLCKMEEFKVKGV